MTNLKNRLLDEVMRIIARKFRLEICAVHHVHWHKEPGDKKFNHIDVVERDRAQETDDTKSYVREKIPVLQSFLGGHCGGYNWTPRKGDLVYVFFYHETKGICLGNFWGWQEYPICRPTPYDIADKGGQWMEPFQDPKTLDFPRQPYPPLKKPYCYRWFHGPVTGNTGKGRDWAWMMDYCQEGDAVKDCRTCLTIDSIAMSGNRGFKFYSHETESKTAHPLRDLFFNESGSYWMFDAKCCGDCSECTEESCCSELFTEGRSFWTIQGANGCEDLKGHLRHYPLGTMEIHSATEKVPFASEQTGSRTSVVADDDDSVDFAWESIFFAKNAYIRCKKEDGSIEINSPFQITLSAPLVVETQNNLTSGNNEIDGSCAHGSCSCPCSGAGGGVTCPTTSIKLDAATGRCMTREPTGEWNCLGDQVLTSCCALNANNICGCNSSGEVWQWDGEEWSCLSTSPTMQECSLGSDGTLCGTKTDQGTVQWDGDSWVVMATGAAVCTAVLDSAHIYIVGSDHTTYGHLYSWNGSDWDELDTTDINYIGVAKDGSLFAILNSDGSLVKWSGTAWGSSLGSATGLKQIAAKSGTLVWAVGSDDTLWYWNGLTWVQSSTETVSGIALAMM